MQLPRQLLQRINHPVVRAPTRATIATRPANRHERDRIAVHANRGSQAILFLESAGEGGVRLHLEPQQLLGLKAGESFKDSIVNQAYDQLILSQLEPGYSQTTVSSRAELLDIARGDIITSKGRSKDRHDSITIPYDLLPGALALLAEVEQNEVVLQLGRELLASGELDHYQAIKQDILLSMALSKCNMARDVFSSGQQIATGCRHLEDALQLLQPKGTAGPTLAPELAREIKASLAELRSQCALEQVSAPFLKDQQDVRKRAVRTIRELLRTQDTDLQAGSSRTGGSSGPGAAAIPAAPVNAEFVGKLLRQLSCEEVVHLQEWEAISRNPAAHKWLYPGLLEHVAAGHILTGFMQRQPTYVKMALNILKHLPSNADVLVSQAVCQVLLGAVQQSVELLQQAEKSGPRTGQAPKGTASSLLGGAWSSSALSFVQDNTPAGEDGLLPGLCLLTELWLAKVAAPLFRDTAGAPPSTALVNYFDDTRVETLITVYDERTEGAGGASSQVAAVVQQIKGTLERMLGEATRAVDTSAQGGGLSVGPLQGRTALLGVVAVGALLVAGGLALVRPRTAASSAPSAASTSRVAASTNSAAASRQAGASSSSSTSVLDLAGAEQLIRRWQDIKQAALSSGYDMAGLSHVLADPLLSETQAKVAQFQKEGWFMKYRLHRLKVTDVDTSALGSRAGYVAVYATLDESAALHHADGRQADNYRTTYDAKYHVIQGKNGAWLVSKVFIAEESTTATSTSK